MRTGLLSVALVALLFPGLLLAGAPVSGTRPAVSAPAEAPSIDAYLVRLYPSPDYTRVALLLNRGTDDQPKLSLAMFDPTARRVLGETPSLRVLSYDDWRHLPVAWSPDGHWVAAVSQPGTVTLLGPEGKSRTFASPSPANLLLWRGDRKGRVIDGVDREHAQGPWSLHETDTITGRGRRIPLSALPVSVFLVRGKPWVAYLPRRSSGRHAAPAIYLAQADPWQQMVRIPLYDLAPWDLADVDVSPDGKYFHCRLYYSAGTLDVVARVADAHRVFREPLRAILWQQGLDAGRMCIDWRQDLRGRSLNRPALARVVVTIDPPDPWDPPSTLDLDTGSRNPLWSYLMAVPEDAHDVVLWKPSELDPFAPLTYLGISSAGLELFPGYGGAPPTLLLKHLSPPEAADP